MTAASASLARLGASSFTALLDAVEEPLLVLDSTGQVPFANAAARRLLGGETPLRVAQLEGCFGAGAVTWLQRLLGTAPPQPVQRGVALPGGEAALLELLRLPGGPWALFVRRMPAAEDDAAVGLPPPPATRPPVRPDPRQDARRDVRQAVGPAARPAARAPVPAIPVADLEPGAGLLMARLFWDTGFPVLVQDAQFRLIAVNEAFVRFAGRPREALLGVDPIAFIHPDDEAPYLEQRAELRRFAPDGLLIGPGDRRLLAGDGTERWYRPTRRHAANARGEVRYVSVLHDTSAEHQARTRADRTAHEMQQWFDLSPVGMVMVDADGLVVRSNPAFEALVGRVPVTLSDAEPTLAALLGWDDGGVVSWLQVGGPLLERHGHVVRPDGTRLRLSARLRVIEPALGERRVLAVVEDRSAEDERDLAQLEMVALMDTAGVGVATFDEARGWLRSASAGPSATPAAGGVQSISREVVDPASMPEYERLQRALKAGERAQVRYAVRHPELGLRWLMTRVEPGQLASGLRTTSVVTLDVTEQQQTRRRNEQLLRELTTILEGTSAGMAYLRGDALVRCNLRFEQMLGLSGGKVAGATLGELFGREVSFGPVMRAGLSQLDAQGHFDSEFELSGRPGTWYSLSVRRAPGEPSDGHDVEAVAVLTDISRLKAQQVELEKLLRERELMFNLSEVGIAYIRDGRVERANQAFAQITGYPPEEVPGLDHARLFEDGKAARHGADDRDRALGREGRYIVERPLRRRDGSLRWVQVSKRPVAPGDLAAGLICSYVDVEDRRRAQDELEQQADRTRAVLNSVLVGIVTVDERGIAWMNRSARRMFGGDLADFVGLPMSTVATPEVDHPLRRTDYMHALAEGQAETFECRLQARDGRAFWVVGNAVLTGGGPTGRQLTFALLDIELRRQAELSIAQAQASLQRIIETAPMAIGLFDARTLRLLQLNQMAAAFFGRVLEDAPGLAVGELFEADTATALEQDMRLALATQQVTQREYQRPAGGHGEAGQRTWDARYMPLAGSADEPPEQLLLVASDVTEQRQAAAARLEAAIAQRDMLVREVHHRIKNNLQGVAGLMQQVAQRRPEVAGVITEAIGQVQAIAQVYGLQVGVSGPLRVRSVVEAIAESVRRNFGRPIEVQSIGGPAHRWGLPEGESIPIALTVNELLTNAVKHGTADPVRCTLDFGDASVSVTITNAGTLPAGFELARVPGGVSGLGLVRALLPRRHATLALAEVPGAARPEVQARVVLVPPGVKLLEPL